MNRISLHPKKHKVIDRLINNNNSKLFELTEGLGSPLHLVFPQIFQENIDNFISVIESHYPNTTLCFAKKANKSQCFIEKCRTSHIGVDVASYGELCKALAGGILGEKIVVSGVGKTEQLYHIAILHGCLIAIDNELELEEVAGFAAKQQNNVNILLRILPDANPNSRFGFTRKDIHNCLDYLKKNHQLTLQGYSFHLCGYSISQRAHTILELIDLCQKSKKYGFLECDTINAGGGIPISYCSEESWSSFQQAMSKEDFHANKDFSDFYPYGNDLAGPDSLKSILNFQFTDGKYLKQLLKQHDIYLMFELGRSLLDQCGISIFTIHNIKSKDDYYITSVGGSSLHLSEQWFNSEFLLEPLLIPQAKQKAKSIRSCIAASTCLESDMLTWRKIEFQQIPTRGDLLVYFNTAGYQMDSNESSFHEMPIPHKVVLNVEDSNGDSPLSKNQYKWRLDCTLT